MEKCVQEADMVIKNGIVYGEDQCFQKRDIFIKNQQFVECADSSDTNVVDAEGLYVLPGLVDVHSHGAVGYDFSDADAKGLAEILRYEKRCGITTYCPTTMTLPKSQFWAMFDAMKEMETTPDMAQIAGINMEGPFLDIQKKGAHAAEYIQEPDIAFFRECNARCAAACPAETGCSIRLVTLAPNAPGALEFIRELKDETTISLGHTAADYDTARQALDAGARHITHLFNAMAPFSHREPGLIGAAAEDKNCMAELICDGIHVHASAVRAAFALFPGRIVLISDSMRAAGMSDGNYTLGGQQVCVKGKLATLSDGTIAGSVTNLYDCMKTAVSFGIPLEEAVAAATINPARSIGIEDKAGAIAAGKRADVLLVDQKLQLVRVIG